MAPKSLSLFDLAPGKTVADRFEIRSSLRHGGMSTTFLVRDAATDGERELQVLPAALFEDGEQREEFLDSMRRWTEVRHPNVLAVHDVLPVGGTILVVTDVPRGETLRERSKREGRMEGTAAGRLGVQLLEGLEVAHAAGVVHGDVKPFTIWVEGAGEATRAVLVDGGITPGLWRAKDLGDKTALIGTPYYAPVEQFGGDSPDVQSDVYNVATVMYELVAGVLPWAGRTFLEVFQAKLQQVAPPISVHAKDVEVDPELERAILGGLMTDRRERWASAAEFRLRLTAIRGIGD